VRKASPKNRRKRSEERAVPLRVDWYDMDADKRSSSFTSFNTNDTWTQKDHERLDRLILKRRALEDAFLDAVSIKKKQEVFRLVKDHFPGVKFREVPPEER